jgi:RNA polymerase sigma-70 factor (ECF subfamily)
LPEEQRTVVVLKVWGELTFQEIATTLDAPLNTVTARYRYALEKLRNRIHLYERA